LCKKVASIEVGSSSAFHLIYKAHMPRMEEKSEEVEELSYIEWYVISRTLLLYHSILRSCKSEKKEEKKEKKSPKKSSKVTKKLLLHKFGLTAKPTAPSTNRWSR
jgi:hypothetical protein